MESGNPELISCTWDSIERARTKPFRLPFEFDFWSLHPWPLRQLYNETSGAFSKWARKQAKVRDRARIGPSETQLKKRAMKILMEMAEQQVEAENQAAEAARKAEPGGKQADAEHQTDAEATEPTRLSGAEKKALMQAIESQTPEQVEQAAQFLAGAARAMAATSDQPINVFDYLEEYSPGPEPGQTTNVFDYLIEDPADEQIQELASKLTSADGISFVELAQVLEAQLVIGNPDAPAETGVDVTTRAPGAPVSEVSASRSAREGSSSHHRSKSSKQSVPGSVSHSKSSSSRHNRNSTKHSLPPAVPEPRSSSSRHHSKSSKQSVPGSASHSKSSSSRHHRDSTKHSLPPAAADPGSSSSRHHSRSSHHSQRSPVPGPSGSSSQAPSRSSKHAMPPMPVLGSQSSHSSKSKGKGKASSSHATPESPSSRSGHKSTSGIDRGASKSKTGENIFNTR